MFWHHGTPNIGGPPTPLFPAAARLGIRWVSHDRPGYGGSTPSRGRNVASAAADVARVADALGIEQFAVMGHSGGGPHALACAAGYPTGCWPSSAWPGWPRSTPRGSTGSGAWRPPARCPCAPPRRDEPRRRRTSSQAREYDPEFTPADRAALRGEWSWLGDVVGPALEAGPSGLIDDDLAYVAPWGFDPAQVIAPALFLHGGRDRVVPSSHSEWLARRCPSAELRLSPDDGHISVLSSAAAALDWLCAHVE